MNFDVGYKVKSKVIQAFHESNARSRLLVGPFRSGKSVAAVIELWLMAREMPVNEVPAKALQENIIARTICVRKTYRMLEDSVIKTFFQWVPKAAGKYSEADKVFLYPLGNGYFWEVLFRSADSPEDIEKFRGVEITNYWIDEAQEVSQDVKLILEGRMSYPAGAPANCFRSILTTNPSDTEHWLYTQYVKDPLDGHVWWKQGVRDNPYLTKEYYDNLELQYRDRPEILRRYVLGEWGAIFSGKPVYGNEFFWDMHVSNTHLNHLTGVDIVCGWDFGLTPACVITQVNPNGQWMILRELWSDDMGIDEFSDLVIDYCNREFPGATFKDVGDPAGKARSTTDEKSCYDILRSKKRHCREAPTNALVPRLESVKRKLTRTAKGNAQMIIDPRCKRLLDGFSGGYRYVERSNTGMYADTPEKNRYSHCLTGDSMVKVPFGEKRIDQLGLGDYVETPVGYRMVTATMRRDVGSYLRIYLTNGKIVRCTTDHPVYTEKGIVRADELQYNDSLVGIKTKEVNEWEGQLSTQSSSSITSGIIRNLRAITNQIIVNMEDVIFTAWYGNTATVPSQRNAASTISMGTSQITISRTLVSTHCLATRNITLNRIFGKYLKKWDEGFSPQEKLRKNGTDPRKDGSGTRNTGERHGKEERKSRLPAWFVGKSIGRIGLLAKEGFARWLASKGTEGPRVKRVEFVDHPATVHDITVDDAHCFFAEGVLVGNCHDALQYAALHLFGYRENMERVFREPLPQQIGVVNA